MDSSLSPSFSFVKNQQPVATIGVGFILSFPESVIKHLGNPPFVTISKQGYSKHGYLLLWRHGQHDSLSVRFEEGNKLRLNSSLLDQTGAHQGEHLSVLFLPHGQVAIGKLSAIKDLGGSLTEPQPRQAEAKPAIGPENEFFEEAIE